MRLNVFFVFVVQIAERSKCQCFFYAVSSAFFYGKFIVFYSFLFVAIFDVNVGYGKIDLV